MAQEPKYSRLRPEARPVGYSKLDTSQQDVFDRLVTLLVGALDGMVATGRGLRRPVDRRIEAPPPWVDYHQASRMAFLDGRRSGSAWGA